MFPGKDMRSHLWRQIDNLFIHWGTIPFVYRTCILSWAKYFMERNGIKNICVHWANMTSFSTWQIPFLAASEEVSWWPQLHVPAARLGGVQLADRDWAQLALLETLPGEGGAVFSSAKGQDCPSELRLLVHMCSCFSILMKTIAS